MISTLKSDVVADKSAYRNPNNSEIAVLEARGNRADDWNNIFVTSDFRPELIETSRFEGRIWFGSGVIVRNSCICNYRIGDNTLVESVVRLECRHRSTFGNGVRVAVMNESGGRQVPIFDALTSQTAYVAAVYRHRAATVARIEELADNYARSIADEVGTIGRNSRIVGARFIREVRIGDNVTIDGASLLENGTLHDNAHAGVDVKLRDFIVAEYALLDNGAIADRCFIGEAVHLDKGFSTADSLFFANCHCENGEAAAVFAGPYTVSHHKSSLLIAGMFSFFNAGSGTNQSNHLFKSGAVHQSVHLRGSKFASNAYVKMPSVEGPFTMILGSHSDHHDTRIFPYSYLVERDGHSILIPAINLTSYGSVRDVGKWPKRDNRRINRDSITFNEYNPYICGLFIDGINKLGELAAAEPYAEVYGYNGVTIRSGALLRGERLYSLAVEASLGDMLSRGAARPEYDGSGRWTDVSGLYITKRAVDELLERLDRGEITSLDALAAGFRDFFDHYDDYAHSWALSQLAERLGRRPDEADIAAAVAAGLEAHKALRKKTDMDRDRDFSTAMWVSYGLDSDSEQEIEADFRSVRGF